LIKLHRWHLKMYDGIDFRLAFPCPDLLFDIATSSPRHHQLPSPAPIQGRQRQHGSPGRTIQTSHNRSRHHRRHQCLSPSSRTPNLSICHSYRPQPTAPSQISPLSVNSSAKIPITMSSHALTILSSIPKYFHHICHLKLLC
jgi:hypothetical protein